MYATYAFGSFTVGVQSSEADGGTAAADDEFSSHGITYQVSDDLTIGYHASEYSLVIKQQIKNLNQCKFHTQQVVCLL